MVTLNNSKLFTMFVRCNYMLKTRLLSFIRLYRQTSRSAFRLWR